MPSRADPDHHRGRPGRGDPRPACPTCPRRTSSPSPARATRPRASGWRPGSSRKNDPDGTMIVMPADHVIEPAEMFLKTVRAAVSVIEDDPTTLVTFGIKPTRPETGYGYIERGELLETLRGDRPSTASPSSARSPTAPPPRRSWPPAASPGTRASSSGGPAPSSTSCAAPPRPCRRARPRGRRPSARPTEARG